jgi:hypothetical protein
MVVFDIVVNGEVKETIKPKTQKLKAMLEFVKEQVKIMKQKYGNNIVINRRLIY